jgi:hypothetical protein
MALVHLGIDASAPWTGAQGDEPAPFAIGLGACIDPAAPEPIMPREGVDERG